MREIKFRAWDELNKIMYLDVDFIRSGDGDNDWIAFQSGGNPFDFNNPNPYFRKQIKLMQYTGLKDKNGVEIYEGDIVLNEYYDEYGKVIYDKGGFLVEYSTWEHDLIESYQYSIVAGNIYENPELLEELK